MKMTKVQANRAYLKLKSKVLGNMFWDPPTLQMVHPGFVNAKQRLKEAIK